MNRVIQKEVLHPSRNQVYALALTAALALNACGGGDQDTQLTTDIPVITEVDSLDINPNSSSVPTAVSEIPEITIHDEQIDAEPASEENDTEIEDRSVVIESPTTTTLNTNQEEHTEESETGVAIEGVFTPEQLKNEFDIEALFNFKPGTVIGHTYSTRGLIDAPLILSESAYESGLFSGLADESQIPEDQHPELKYAGDGVVVSLDTRIPGAYRNDDSTKFAHKTSGDAPLGNIDQMQIGDRVLDVYVATEPNDYGVDRLALESEVIDIFTIPFDAGPEDEVVSRYGADNAFELLYDTKKVINDDVVTQTYYSCGTDSEGLGSRYRWGVVVQLNQGYINSDKIDELVEEYQL